MYLRVCLHVSALIHHNRRPCSHTPTPHPLTLNGPVLLFLLERGGGVGSLRGWVGGVGQLFFPQHGPIEWGFKMPHSITPRRHSEKTNNQRRHNGKVSLSSFSFAFPFREEAVFGQGAIAGLELNAVYCGRNPNAKIQCLIHGKKSDK